jgi:hypothetical protein
MKFIIRFKKELFCTGTERILVVLGDSLPSSNSPQTLQGPQGIKGVLLEHMRKQNFGPSLIEFAERMKLFWHRLLVIK